MAININKVYKAVLVVLEQEKRGVLTPNEFNKIAEGLTFSVILYLCCSTACIITLIIRRCLVKGELGGSSGGRAATAVFFIGMWVIYVALSACDQYGLIDTF